MARLRAREEEKQAADAVAPAKKEAAEAKKARDTTSRVLLGSELLEKIKQGGPQVLRKLKIDELHALLIDAYPQNSLPRPNKKEGLEKVEELGIVQDALRIFGSTRISAPLLPQPPPTTNESPPLLDNIDFRPSIGSVESSKVLIEVDGSVVASTLAGIEDLATAVRL
jgi:hypothetical protein